MAAPSKFPRPGPPDLAQAADEISRSMGGSMLFKIIAVVIATVLIYGYPPIRALDPVCHHRAGGGVRYRGRARGAAAQRLGRRAARKISPNFPARAAPPYPCTYPSQR